MIGKLWRGFGRARGLAAAAFAFFATGGAAQGQSELPEPIDRMIQGFFVGPVRYRHEYRDDHDLRRDLDDGDNRDLLKVGFGVDARPIDELRGRVSLRFTRSWGRNKVNPALELDPFGQDQLDLFEGFGEIGPFEGVPISFRAGRQVLSYGEERLIGPLEFVQNPRTWDGLKLIIAGEKAGGDLFWGRRVQFKGPDDHNANRPIDTVDFFGAYGYLKFPSDFRLEPFYLVKYDDNHVVRGETGRSGHVLLRHCPGVRAVSNMPGGLTLEGDLALQLGERGKDEIFAWAAGTKATWRVPEEIRPLYELEAEYFFGSGDANPRDGKAGTFDNFYPTNHRFYGEIDFVSWQNIHALELTARLALGKLALREAPPSTEPGKPPARRSIAERAYGALVPPTISFFLELGGHFFWLAAKKDAWYNAGGVALRRDLNGDAGRDLGREFDLLFRAGALSVAYAHFFPGEFVRETTPAGGKVSGADMVYAEFAIAF